VEVHRLFHKRCVRLGGVGGVGVLGWIGAGVGSVGGGCGVVWCTGAD